MRSFRAVSLLRWILVLIPVIALAQLPPPPPPPGPLLPPPQPPGNPVTVAKANLGKALFWDEQLSSTRTVACGSCHQAVAGGSDRRSTQGSARSTNPGLDAVAGTPDDVRGSPGVTLNESDGTLDWSTLFGIREQVTGRLAPSYINAAYSPELFWDGRAGGTFLDPVTGAAVLQNGAALESQASGPPVSSGEMGHLGRDWNNVAARVASSRPLALAGTVPAALSGWIAGRGYPELFNEAFGSPDVTPSRIAMAIASYERTQFSNQTPFDSANAGATQLTPLENQGRQLFGALPCARCHGGPLTSDNRYHYIGVRPVDEDLGRFNVTGQPGDRGAFRTPSLRNVALRPSFMHDGRFATLGEVVDFYDRGGDFNAPNKSPLITPLNLTQQQKNQLLAFLGRPLTDPRVAASADPFDHPTLFSESGAVPRLVGGGVAGDGGVPQVIALQPPLAGNPAFTVGIYGARALAEAVLVIDDNDPPTGNGIPASASFARLATTLKGGAGNDGFGSVTLAIPDDPALYGRQLFGRWYVSDPTAPGGVSASPSFTFLVFGPSGAGLASAPSLPGVRTPTLLRIYAAQPNPFVRGTRIRYEVLLTSPVRLTIYDLSGRVVRRLVDEKLHAPGTYTVAWDGRDDAGRVLAGGVFFSRIEGGGVASSYRVVRTE